MNTVPWHGTDRRGPLEGTAPVLFLKDDGKLAGFDKNPAKTIGIGSGVWYNTHLISGRRTQRMKRRPTVRGLPG